MKLKLKTIPPVPQAPVYKASLHKTGKIGFAIDTAKHFGISTQKGIELAINDEDKEDENIYGILTNSDSPTAYKILKAGDYHSINAKGFFETLGVDYANANINYNVSEINVEGVNVLKFETIKKNKEERQ